MYHTINEFPKWDSPSLFAHNVTHFLHNSVHVFQKIMAHNCKNIINDILCPTRDTIILWEYILDANNREVADSFMG
jgi:hypothetical protein